MHATTLQVAKRQANAGHREAGCRACSIEAGTLDEAGQGGPWQPARAVPREATRECATEEPQRMHGA